MALSNSSNVTKRIDVNRRLTFGEMDENFEQLKLVITDVGTLELQLGDKVSTLVYDNKIADIDASILALENALVGAVSEEFVNQLESRITVNEQNILTLQGNLADIINDTTVAVDATWSSSKINSELGDRDTEINNLNTNKRDISNTSFPRYDLDSVSTTATLDLATGNEFTIDASAPRTLTFANVPTGRSMTVVLSITGASAITWPAGIRWHGDGTTASELGATWTIVVLNYDGVNWSGVLGASA